MTSKKNPLVARLLTASWLVAIAAVVLAFSAQFFLFRLLAMMLAVTAVMGASGELAGFTLRNDQSVVRKALVFLLGTLPATGCFLVTILPLLRGGTPILLERVGPEGLATSREFAVFVGLGACSLVGATVSLIARFEGASSSGEAALDYLISSILLSFGGGVLVLFSLFPPALFWLVAVVSVNDSAAFFVGKKVGKRKLSPRASPGKTWEGSFAGIAAGALTAGTFSLLLRMPPELTGWCGPMSAMLVVVGAQAGDLAKSVLKRKYGVKDSGSLLPGHGGLLDRIDGHLGGCLVLLSIFLLG